jgi:hypothetical protein
MIWQSGMKMPGKEELTYESSLIFLLRAPALFSLLHSSPLAANTT